MTSKALFLLSNSYYQLTNNISLITISLYIIEMNGSRYRYSLVGVCDN